MRLPIALLALLALPASAPAATVGLEGTQLVYRTDAGERADVFVSQGGDGLIRFDGPVQRSGPGCTGTDRIECAEAGVTGVAVITGDGNDRVSAYTLVPVALTLGAGDDEFAAQSSAAVTVDAGLGNDSGLSQARTASLAGGEGDDRLTLETQDFMRAPLVLDGGAGDASRRARAARRAA